MGYATEGEPQETMDVRNVLRAAKRVQLDDEQRDLLRDLERSAIGAYRKINRKDEAAMADLAAKVRDDVLEILEEDQAEEFNAQLSRLQRSNRRR